MITRRQQQEIVFLMVLCACADGIQKIPRYKHLVIAGPFPAIVPLQQKLDRWFPDDNEKRKFVLRCQKIVNDILPPGFLLWAAEMKYWFAGQVCLRLVASGWRPPQDEEAAIFVQALYDLSGQFKPPKAPSDEVLRHLVKIAEEVRDRHDLFNPASLKV